MLCKKYAVDSGDIVSYPTHNPITIQKLLRRRSHNSLNLKSDVFKNSPKVTKKLGYFCTKIAGQELSKSAQSGHTCSLSLFLLFMTFSISFSVCLSRSHFGSNFYCSSSSHLFDFHSVELKNKKEIQRQTDLKTSPAPSTVNIFFPFRNIYCLSLTTLSCLDRPFPAFFRLISLFLANFIQ